MSMTTLALLGTLGHVHQEPIRFNWTRLREIVLQISPDLLCAEITPYAWESKDWSKGSPEVRAVLGPLALQTEIVLVPVLPSNELFTDFIPASGWRRMAGFALNRILEMGKRAAGSPEAVNGSVFRLFCHAMCRLIEWTWTTEIRDRWKLQNDRVASKVIQVARNDPGRRVLVAVQCQRLHEIETRLLAHSRDGTVNIEVIRHSTFKPEQFWDGASTKQHEH